MLARAGTTATGPDVLARFLDRLVSAGLDRALAHVAWHALLSVVVGSVAQERARNADQVAVFDAVLDVAMTGLLAAAQKPPTPQAIALLDAHALARNASVETAAPRHHRFDLWRADQTGNSPDAPHVPSVASCVGRRFRARAGLTFMSCYWWLLLAIDGGSGTSRGHIFTSDPYD